MEGLSAVMADTNRDRSVVEELADVVGVNTLDIKAGQADSSLPDTRAEDGHPRYLVQPDNKMLPESRFVLGDAVDSDVVEVVDGARQRYRLRNALGTGLEPMRGWQIFCAVHSDGGDHRSSGEEWRQCIE